MRQNEYSKLNEHNNRNRRKKIQASSHKDVKGCIRELALKIKGEYKKNLLARKLKSARNSPRTQEANSSSEQE